MNKWEKYRFSDFVLINPPVKIPQNEYVSFVEMKDLEDGKRYCEPSQERLLSGGSRFQDGDTLFARITPCLENGKICQVRGLKKSIGFGSTEFHVFRGKKGVSDTDFVYYLSRCANVRDHAEINLDGTSGRQRVPKQIFDDLFLILPPIEEQTTIKSVLGDLDNKIDLFHRQNVTLEKMMAALFRQWFVESIVNEEFEELGKYADNIRVNIKAGELSDYSHYIGLEHVPRKSITITELGTTTDLESSKYLFEEDDILFGKLRSYFHKIVFAPVKGVCSTDILVIRAKKPEWMAFCLFWFSSKDVVEFSDLGSGGTRMPRTSWEILSKYKIPRPDILKIEKFNSIVTPFISKIKINQTQIKALKTLRDTLLPKLMSGEVRVNLL